MRLTFTIFLIGNLFAGSFLHAETESIKAKFDLGPTPLVGKTWQLPKGCDGVLVIEEYRSDAETLTFRVNGPFSANPILAPRGFATPCQAGQKYTRDVGDICSFWFGSADVRRVVYIWWGYEKSKDGFFRTPVVYARCNQTILERK